MSKKILFAIIASVVVGHAFADSKTITTQDYVDTADALKQDIITTGLVDFENSYEEYQDLAALVSYDTTSGVVGNKYGILPGAAADSAYSYALESADNLVPTVGLLAKTFAEISGIYQTRIPGENTQSYNIDQGNLVMTFPMYEGDNPSSRHIFDGSATYNSATNSTNIPTMGAVMAAISANAPTLPTGTAGNVVTYNASGQIGGSVATYNGSTTYNASTDASKIAVMSAVQRKMTCARYVQNADQTAENCLLWNVPD